ncbi:MAG: DNA-processing protein DprA [Clostridiaceae bacterium]|nr:DNA-processing protein DprA [Clostridiaceae bacterium]
MKEKLYDFWLCNLPQIGMRKRQRLLEYFGSSSEVFQGTKEQYRQVAGLRDKDICALLAARDGDQLKRCYDNMVQKGISFVSIREEEYPKQLRQIADAPYGLFYKGCLPQQGMCGVAIVGAREASFEGVQIARKFGYELAANGIQVVSGMARGVDISAQRGAMDVPGGRTFAVLGTGIDICYPRQHIEEYMRMQEYGGVISEFPLHSPPLPFQFALRNRLISGLCDGVLLIEAKKDSGSLITAEAGLDQGREIFVVPGGILNSQYEGSNGLIKQGAVPVTGITDILDGLGMFFDQDVIERKKKSEVLLETAEKIVYAILSLEPIHVSEIVKQTGFPLQKVMEIVLALEMKKMIYTVGNNYFVIRL